MLHNLSVGEEEEDQEEEEVVVGENKKVEERTDFYSLRFGKKNWTGKSGAPIFFKAELLLFNSDY